MFWDNTFVDYYLNNEEPDGNMDIVNSYWKNDRGRITGIGES